MFSMDDPFMYVEAMFRTWLEGARLREIGRLLDLIGEELRRRGFTLTWMTAPPMPDDRSLQ